MQSATKKRIGILRGGAGHHYAFSLKRGGDIIAHIHGYLGEKYKPADILVDKGHIWHFNGLPVSPADLVGKVDIIWNVSHPSLSYILDSLSIPNIGTGSFPFTLENSRDMLREHMQTIGVEMPRAVILPAYQKDLDGPRERYAIRKAKEVFEKFSPPWVVRSFVSDPEMGVHVAKTFPELVGAIEDGVKRGESVLVEELVAGKGVSIHSIPGFRGQILYTFPFGDPAARFSDSEREILSRGAKNIHWHIGAGQYLKSDLVLTPRGRVYLLRVESVPDLRPGSRLAQACEFAGAEMRQVIDHILESAFN